MGGIVFNKEVNLANLLNKKIFEINNNLSIYVKDKPYKTNNVKRFIINTVVNFIISILVYFALSVSWKVIVIVFVFLSSLMVVLNKRSDNLKHAMLAVKSFKLYIMKQIIDGKSIIVFKQPIGSLELFIFYNVIDEIHSFDDSIYTIKHISYKDNSERNITDITLDNIDVDVLKKIINLNGKTNFDYLDPSTI